MLLFPRIVTVDERKELKTQTLWRGMLREAHGGQEGRQKERNKSGK